MGKGYTDCIAIKVLKHFSEPKSERNSKSMSNQCCTPETLSTVCHCILSYTWHSVFRIIDNTMSIILQQKNLKKNMCDIIQEYYSATKK